MKAPNDDMLLEIRGLRFAYPAGPPVLQGVDLDLRQGERVALVGPNGCGKSTLIGLASHVLRAPEGAIRLQGRPLGAVTRRQFARQVGVLPQAVPASVPFCVEDVVRMGRFAHRGLFGAFTATDEQAVAKALEQTETEALRAAPIAKLSGGERQRVFLAKALAQQPQLLLLDEPTGSLDLHYQVQILSLIRDLHAAADFSVLAVMHDLNLASLFFERILVLHGGAIVADGSPADVLTQDRIQRVHRVAVDVSVDDRGRPRVLLHDKPGLCTAKTQGIEGG